MADRPAFPPQARRSLLDALVYTFGNVWTTVLSAVASLVTRALVLPDAFGATSVVYGLMGYFGAYNSIFRNALSQEIPAHLARGQAREADEIAAAAYTTLLGSVLVQSTMLLAFAWLVHEPLLRLAALTGVFLNLVEAISMQDRIMLQATQRFLALGIGQVISGLFSPVVLIVLAWRAGVTGYFLGLALGGAVRGLAYRVLLRRSILTLLTFRVTRSALSRVLATGSGIAVLTLAGQLLLTVDRWTILYSLGTRDLGYYSLGSTMLASLVVVPASIAGAYFPTMVRSVATGQIAQARFGTRRAQAAVTLTTAILFAALALTVPLAITWILASYRPVIVPLQVMSLQGYFYGSIMVASQVHIASRRLLRAVLLTAAFTPMALGLSLGLIRYGLTGVATAMGIGWGVYAVAFNWSADRLLQYPGLVGHVLLGGGIVAMTLAVYFLVGPIAAWATLLVSVVAVLWYLTRLLGIDWRALPSSAKVYASSRG